MGFLRDSNRHDSWLRFSALHAELLSASHLPVALTHSEDRFRDLLRDGAAGGRGWSVALVNLSADQWAALERFAAVFFRECESLAPFELFPAFRREKERRASH